MKRLLTIAGSDSGGGAGIQADLKTFHAFDCYGMSVLTAVTAQNTMGVHGVVELPAGFVAEQFKSVASDIGVDAAKTGMLANADIVSEVAKMIRRFDLPHLVVDPVMLAKGGDPLLRKEARAALMEELVPLAELVTPNIPEAEVLSGISVVSIDDMKQAARLIYQRGTQNVLVKGGHREPDATDVLFDGREFYEYHQDRIDTQNTHGTGCTYSAAIACNLATGLTIPQAVKMGKEYVTRAIRESLTIGQGIGPLNHFVKPSQMVN
ncbi:bifunctional hydroxymethylpyrimidine kinase/phosphomethylpyrimidine kinase [bacterium]|nr:bifunctional hydroxymethylpyrimidine kinase/phosphomethylpyrimidine kinase [bacterium]